MSKQRLYSLLALLMLAVTGVWADDWTNIIINGSLEGSDRQCFFVKENSLGSENIYYAKIQDGIGTDGTRAIAVQSTGTETNPWDSQFFVRLPYELPAGTQYRVSFDYKADKAGECDLQSQNEPGEYIIWYINEAPLVKSCSFTTSWQTFNSGDMAVPSACNGEQCDPANGDFLNNFQTISFSLGNNGIATKYIIDNIKVEILSSVASGLTESPNPKVLPQYPVDITSLAIMGDFLGKGADGNWKPANGWAFTQDASKPNLWTLTKEFEAEAKTYEYQVFANGNLDDYTYPVYGKGQLVISEARKYILNITVDTEANTVSIVATPTFNVTFAEGIDEADKWSAQPNEGVKEGDKVTVTYTGTKKVLGVKAEKKAKAPATALAPALENGATVVIICDWGDATTTFTYTNNGGTFSGQVSGFEAGYFHHGLELNGKNLSFGASDVDNSEYLSVGITFNTESSAYSYTGKGEDFSSFTISVNGTDITDQLSELK